MLKDILPLLELNGQFDKLTDRTEGTLVPELAEGASPNSIFIPSFTHLAPNYVFFIPCLCFCLFRVIPCSSVANASAYSSFRVLLLLILPSVANAYSKFRRSRNQL